MDPKEFINILESEGVDLVTGVPDSLLKPLCLAINQSKKTRHIITANEGSALALAAGHYLATGKLASVYLQNSGLGNIINPLTSLTDKEVYSIPAMLLIGWRGEPGQKDEPQHVKQGEITLETLSLLGIKYTIVSKNLSIAKKQVHEAFNNSKKEKAPHALVFQRKTFKPIPDQKSFEEKKAPTREQSIETIVRTADPFNSIYISTTGLASRELFEVRQKNKLLGNRDFLTIGSMGHASLIALGIALNQKGPTICIDGDGAALMHLGNMATIAAQAPGQYIHIILNNECHESVGGQATTAPSLQFSNIAKACNYKQAVSCTRLTELNDCLTTMLQEKKGPYLLEVKIKNGHRKDLGRPTISPKENKEKLMHALQQ